MLKRNNKQMPGNDCNNMQTVHRATQNLALRQNDQDTHKQYKHNNTHRSPSRRQVDKYSVTLMWISPVETVDRNEEKNKLKDF